MPAPREITEEALRALYDRYCATRLTLAQVAAEAGASVWWLQGEFMRRGWTRKSPGAYRARATRPPRRTEPPLPPG